MTADALAGRPTSFYPLGRAIQRPRTLQLSAGETVGKAVRSLHESSASLDAAWDLTAAQWQTMVHEPAGEPDLGPISLAMLALLRLTEVEVHGADLDIGAAPWSDLFVDLALPMRVQWLTTRRSNEQILTEEVYGSWALCSSDGPSFVVHAEPGRVLVLEDGRADVTIVGTARSLLGFLLGRTPLQYLDLSGDIDLAHRWHDAFPAP